MKRKAKAIPTQDPRPVPHSKYPDRDLSKALWKAVRVSEVDPVCARIAWQEAYDLVQRRGCCLGKSMEGDDAGGRSISAAVHRLGPDAWDRQGAIELAYIILTGALSMNRMLATPRHNLAKCAYFFSASRSRPSVQDERAARTKVFIREKFARTRRPVSATVIAKHLGGDVTRHTVITYIYPLLCQDTGFTLAGRGPAAGWKPLA